MKKRPVKKSPNIASMDREYTRSLANVMMRASNLKDGEELRDSSCEKYPPCVVCHRGGDLVRKCFFPLDFEPQLKHTGSTFCIAICPSCFQKKLEEDVAYQLINLKEIGIRIK